MLLRGELVQAYRKRLRETGALRDGQLQGFGFQLGKVHRGDCTAWLTYRRDNSAVDSAAPVLSAGGVMDPEYAVIVFPGS
ncbi:hypothetical protein WMF28_39480 [Sorangium sp. So ce590]|uniref:hypothetical protein n=1 Tax=Sorangium sp. So ce590 TaxID=3133317 RepID=UPI003F5F39AA